MIQGAVRETAADILKLKGIIARMEKAGGTYTAEKNVELFHAPENDGCFISFALRLIDQLKQIGKKRTVYTYTTALNSFRQFRSELDVLLEDVDSNLMIEYESWLKENGICKNTISFYMRNLRAIYN